MPTTSSPTSRGRVVGGIVFALAIAAIGFGLGFLIAVFVMATPRLPAWERAGLILCCAVAVAAIAFATYKLVQAVRRKGTP